MTTGPDHREPLDAEERDLAALLGRAGPLDEPSASLDAKILAAAHAAAAPRRANRRRAWFAWVGVPPALVTGVGVAAAAVLALGLVWQLRPRSSLPAVYKEAAGAGEEVFVIVEPSDSARPPVANPPPFPAEPAPAMRDSAASAPAAKVAGEPAPRQSAAETASRAVADADAAAAAAAREADATARQTTSADEERRAAAAASDQAVEGFVAAPPPPAPAPAAAPAAARKQAHASYTTAARANAERRERNAAPAPAAPAAPAAAQEADAAMLDRIEVTGSRIERGEAEAPSLAQIPIHEDTGLAVADWLQRIRDRRDEGDPDGARSSLRLFRREHPRVRIPDDLRRLLADSTPADARQ